MGNPPLLGAAGRARIMARSPDGFIRPEDAAARLITAAYESDLASLNALIDAGAVSPNECSSATNGYTVRRRICE